MRRRYSELTLPYDAEVEYIENSQGAYIDTGVIPRLTDRLSAKVMLMASTSADGGYNFFGCFTARTKEAYIFDYNFNNKQGYNRWGNNANRFDRAFNSLKVWYNVEFKEGRTYVNGSSSEAVVLDAANNPKYSMYLFCANSAGNPFPNVSGATHGRASKRIAYVKLFDENDELILDMIPVRIGDVGYMYDRVSRQLFGNAGTGAFVVGPDVVGGVVTRCNIGVYVALGEERRAA